MFLANFLKVNLLIFEMTIKQAFQQYVNFMYLYKIAYVINVKYHI